jgi:hypothetical protein
MASKLSCCVLVLCLSLAVRGQLDEKSFKAELIEQQRNIDGMEAQQLDWDNMEQMEAEEMGEEAEQYSEMFEETQLNADPFEAEQRYQELFEADQFNSDPAAEAEELSETLEAERVAGLLEEDQFNSDPAEAEELYAEMAEAEQLDADKVPARPWFSCSYRCRKGLTAVKNDSYTPTSNGCRSKGGSVISAKDCPYLTDCCNAHDICYGTFGQTKSSCDATFRACNNQAPSDMSTSLQERCKRSGARMSSKVRFSGCFSYKRAQGRATICQ